MDIKTIMVIDDSEADHLIAEVTIKDFSPSIDIIKAYDGREALDILANLDDHPCLILLDINMPAMDGFEFLEEYEKLYTSTVVAMLSSSDQDKDKDKANEFDLVKKYIVKPITIDDLKDISEL